MKKILFILTFMYACFSASAQVPQTINFQGTAYDSNGKVAYNQSIYLAVSILNGSTIEFKGSTVVITNPVGAFSISINQDSLTVSTGMLDTISWNMGAPKVLQVDIALDANPSHAVSYATIALATVPYAFAAQSVQGVNLNSINDGEVLTYDSAQALWKAKSLGGGLIQGNGIKISSSTISVNLQAGTGINISGDTLISTAAMGGDVTGNITNNTVNKLQGVSVSSTAPTTGQILQYNGAQWVPFTLLPPKDTTLTSGVNSTYNTPPGALYLKVRIVGGGGGGAGGGGAGATSGGSGSNTTFGVSLIAGGGHGGGTNTYSTGGAGGTSSGGNILNITGGAGQGGNNATSGSTNNPPGGVGGISPFGGGGSSIAAPSNTGSGGGGGYGPNQWSGPGGGAGGYIETIITSPQTQYSYTVGTGGAGGNLGAYGGSGGNGANGVIIIEAFFQ